jgi:hypothetical protein
MEAQGIKHLVSNLAEVHLIVDLGLNRVAVANPDPQGGNIVVESPLGTTLSDVKIISPVPPGAPADTGVPWLLGFEVSFPVDSPYSSGFPILVTIVLPPNSPHYTTYYQHEPVRVMGIPYWYPFMYDPPHGHTTGAEFRTGPGLGQQTIILHLIAHGGPITDPGGPGFFMDPARNFVASLYEDILGRGPTDAEMVHWGQKLDRGQSRLKVAQTIWNTDEHRRLQVDQWSMQLLGHAPNARQEARWVNLLRRGRGEIAVEQAILMSPEYRRAHPTMASFLAGLNHDVLNQAGDPFEPSQARLRRHRGPVSRATMARAVLTSPAAAAILAQQDATTFVGRPAMTQEARADGLALRRGPTAPARIAERILASPAFYDFVNSALPMNVTSSRPGRHAHQSAPHRRGH